MNIGIDLDDVLAQFAVGFIDFYNSRYDTSYIYEEIDEYDTWKVIDLTQRQFHERIYEFYDSDEFTRLLPEDNSKDVIAQLAEDHQLFIVTSRPDYVAEKTDIWIREHFPQIKTILHSNQFTLKKNVSVTKQSLCKDNNITVMIDDAPKYVDELIDGGIPTIMYDKPWNQKYDTQSRQGKVTRTGSWTEIPEIIEEIGQ